MASIQRFDDHAQTPPKVEFLRLPVSWHHLHKTWYETGDLLNVIMIIFSSRSVLLSVYYPQIFLILTSGSYLRRLLGRVESFKGKRKSVEK
ncbi:unnamed protein product [Arctogadus glacialis]